MAFMESVACHALSSMSNWSSYLLPTVALTSHACYSFVLPQVPTPVLITPSCLSWTPSLVSYIRASQSCAPQSTHLRCSIVFLVPLLFWSLTIYFIYSLNPAISIKPLLSYHNACSQVLHLSCRDRMTGLRKNLCDYDTSPSLQASLHPANWTPHFPQIRGLARSWEPWNPPEPPCLQTVDKACDSSLLPHRLFHCSGTSPPRVCLFSLCVPERSAMEKYIGEVQVMGII